MVGGEITISNPIYKHATTSAVKLLEVDLLKATIEETGGVLAKFNATG
jgi:hypothetical protein